MLERIRPLRAGVIYGLASWMFVACGGSSNNSDSTRSLNGTNSNVIDNGAATNARRAAGREEWERAKDAARSDYASRSNSDPLIKLQNSSKGKYSGESSGTATDVPKGVESDAVTDGLMFVGMAGLGMYLMNGGLDLKGLIPQKSSTQDSEQPAADNATIGQNLPLFGSLAGNSLPQPGASPTSPQVYAASAEQTAALFKDPHQLMAVVQKNLALQPELTAPSNTPQNLLSDKTQGQKTQNTGRSSGSGDNQHASQQQMGVLEPQRPSQKQTPDSACPPQTTQDDRLAETQRELDHFQDQVSAKLSKPIAQEGSTR